MSTTDATAIDEFVARSRALNGQEIKERALWNTVASADAIRHFAVGTCDANPLWIDPEYAAAHHHGRVLAPPAFLISVLYPILHGAPMPVPMANLISDLGFEWERPLLEGDRLRASARQIDAYEARRRDGQRLVGIVTETTYWNQHDDVVARARGTMVWIERRGMQLIERGVHRYSGSEIEAYTHALRTETRRGRQLFEPDEIVAGHGLPELLRGPLTIGDIVGWQAASGPFFQPGTLGKLSPGTTGQTKDVNPLTGWPVTTSLQHEDFHLNRQRGMPAPFDNGAMRFAWAAPLLTNWMGDHGFVKRLRLRLKEPVIYGDMSHFHATISGRVETSAGVAVQLRIRGVNQFGTTTTTGAAEVLLPAAAFAHRAPPARSAAPRPARPRTDPGTAWECNDTSDRGDVLECAAHALFEAQVERRPDAVAVRCGDAAVSYDALNRRANRLAHHLRHLGVGGGVRVAMVLGRTEQALVAIVGTAKAGATRVCFDPAYTGERLGALMTATGATVLLADAGSEGLARGVLPPGTQVVHLEGDGTGLPSACDDNPDGDIRVGDLAYILFTSGSVSTPKAVGVSHASLGRYIASIRAPLGITAGDAYLHSASFAFSAAERQAWLPLSTGATLVLARDTERADPVALFESMRAQGVTVWDTVPSWLRWSMDRLEQLEPTQRAALLANGLRLVLLTGEPLPWALPARWITGLGQQARLMNLYSQTETAGTTCTFPVDALPESLEGTVPIGRAVDHTRVYVLDDALRPVPVGAVGEICVAGERLASGYLGEPRLSAERFVADPFSSDPTARLYRSGDLGRVRADGNLEHVGRLDNRIKLRGFRIDPTEIEAALAAYRGVREAAVGCDEGGSRLVAYLVGDGERPAIEALRDHVGARFPSYMVPAVYRWVEQLPRTPSGKINRGAPLGSSSQRPALAQPLVQAEDAIEQHLAEEWAEILGLDGIGVEDDFFDLGGDSLLAVSAVVAAERRLGRTLSLDWLYDAPTVRSFAQRLHFPAAAGDTPSVITLQRGGTRDAIFFVPGGGGYPFSYHRLARLLGDDQPCYGLQLPGLDGNRAALDRVEAIAAEFIDQIRHLQPSGPYHLVGYSFGGLVVYEMARQIAGRGESVGLLGLLDTPGPGAFRPAPLSQRLRLHRARLARLPPAGRVRYLRDLVVRRAQRLSRSLRPAPLPDDRAAQSSPLEHKLVTVRRAKREASRRYQPQPYSGRLWLFRAEPDEWMGLAEVDPQYGWGSLCAGGVEVRPVAGHHSTLLEEPHVHVLARQLREALHTPGALAVETGAADNP